MPLSNLSPTEQAAYLRLVLDSTIEGFYAVDTEGNTTVCNKAFLRLLGFDSADEVVGRKLHGEIHHSHPDGSHYEVTDCPIYNAASKGIGKFIEHEYFFRKDGSELSVEYRAEPIYFDNKLQGAICTFRDIDEKQRDERELKAVRDQLELAQEVGGVGLFSIDLKTNILTPTRELCKIYGLDYAETISPAVIENAALPEDRKLVSTPESRNKGDVILDNEYRIKKIDTGEVRWISRKAKLIKDEGNKPVQMLGSIQDITDRKLNALDLQEKEQHLSLMLSSAYDYAIISMDADGIIISWSNGAENVFGYKSKDMIGESIEKIFTDEDIKNGASRYELIAAATKGRASDERWHERADGERFYASGIVTAMMDNGNNVSGFVKIARDMTRQKMAEEALFEARNAAEAANIAKTEFLANMSHEIRTPMNAIIGLSNILAMSNPLTEKQREFLKTLQSSADSMLSLINDLLDIAKIEARNVELEQIPFSVNTLIQEVASMMSVRVKEKGLTFTGEGECVKDRMFIGDPTRIRQIVLNLCSNAIKFTDKGGIHVDITCCPTQNKNIESVCIAVKDTGIGIPQDSVDKIFQKFVQADTSINRKYGGTGLGLAITKTLAEIMGGSIEVESKVGKGSTFKVYLPLQIATRENVAASDGSISSLVNNALEKRINSMVLLVEDYEPNIIVAKSYLEGFGYKVDIALNGHEAFEKIKSNNYVACLMDVQMHGMNGLEATQLIRNHEKINKLNRLPIIGITAHALAGDRERCLGVGMDDYMPKPYNPDSLQEKLKNLVSLAKG